MDLSERERRELAELEHALIEEDPVLAGQLGSWEPRPPRRRGIGSVLRWFGWRRT
ncbi:MAG: hypothetical protein QOK11_2448 [Pseudonocardiales bacterium]|jgi:hypothetical protein|nr:hypothetical protein [Pseudonocardiales bacterium]MDT4946472.1 hypothetical protein [Pseudonocardiales bacterium]